MSSTTNYTQTVVFHWNTTLMESARFLWSTIDDVGYNSRVPSAKSPESIYYVFGRRLRELREKQGMPRQELGILSGLTRASIANIESGRQRVFLHQILQFAEALNIDLVSLVPRNSEVVEIEEVGETNPRSDYLKRIHEAATVRGTPSHENEKNGRAGLKRVRNQRASRSTGQNIKEIRHPSSGSSRKR
jgi:transcriptional regulator with XRE-family HTH domain